MDFVISFLVRLLIFGVTFIVTLLLFVVGFYAWNAWHDFILTRCPHCRHFALKLLRTDIIEAYPDCPDYDTIARSLYTCSHCSRRFFQGGLDVSSEAIQDASDEKYDEWFASSK